MYFKIIVLEKLNTNKSCVSYQLYYEGNALKYLFVHDMYVGGGTQMYQGVQMDRD